MGGAARRCVLLGFNQPRPSFCGGCFDAFGGAFSTIEDLRRLAPAVPSRELYRQQGQHSCPMLAGAVAANSRKTPKRLGVVAARRFGEQANHHSLSSPPPHRDE